MPHGEEFDVRSEADRTLEKVGTVVNSVKSIMSATLVTEADLASRASQVVAQYYDPEKKRAVLIQQSARELAIELARSQAELVGFASHSAATALHAQQALLEIRMRGAKAAQDALLVESEDPGKAVAILRKRLESREAESDVSLLSIIVIGRSLITAATEAGLWVGRWEHQLENYLGQVPPSETLTLLETFRNELAEEGIVGVAEHVLVELLGMSSPVGGAIVSIGKLVTNLRRKAAELKEGQGRNDVDEMLDLLENLTLQREAMATVTELLEETWELSQLQLQPAA